MTGATGLIFREISIHALLAESDLINTYHRIFGGGISIHALLAESDFTCAGWFQVIYNFYPRSPCGERLFLVFGVSFICIFLSTLSLRRATAADISERRGANISIHALLAESDLFLVFGISFICIFLSTLSLRRATVHCVAAALASKEFLSTLSLRRATKIPNQRKINQKNFYPRSPCGERPSGGHIRKARS